MTVNLQLDLRMNVCSCNIGSPCLAETLVESVREFSHAGGSVVIMNDLILSM